MVNPWMSVPVVAASIAIGCMLAQVAKNEFGVRKGRHRGFYRYWNFRL